MPTDYQCEKYGLANSQAQFPTAESPVLSRAEGASIRKGVVQQGRKRPRRTIIWGCEASHAVWPATITRDTPKGYLFSP